MCFVYPIHGWMDVKLRMSFTCNITNDEYKFRCCWLLLAVVVWGLLIHQIFCSCWMGGKMGKHKEICRTHVNSCHTFGLNKYKIGERTEYGAQFNRLNKTWTVGWIGSVSFCRTCVSFGFIAGVAIGCYRHWYRSWHCTKWISVFQEFPISQGKHCMMFLFPAAFRSLALFTFVRFIYTKSVCLHENTFESFFTIFLLLLYLRSPSQFKLQRIHRRQYIRFMDAVCSVLFSLARLNGVVVFFQER